MTVPDLTVSKLTYSVTELLKRKVFSKWS